MNAIREVFRKLGQRYSEVMRSNYVLMGKSTNDQPATNVWSETRFVTLIKIRAYSEQMPRLAKDRIRWALRHIEQHVDRGLPPQAWPEVFESLDGVTLFLDDLDSFKHARVPAEVVAHARWTGISPDTRFSRLSAKLKRLGNLEQDDFM